MTAAGEASSPAPTINTSGLVVIPRDSPGDAEQMQLHDVRRQIWGEVLS